jgi:glycosyltransferase involved in cell wall biosynthesis
VLREAMASRKPIIASDTDGVPELIKDGYNGLLFKNGDVDALERQLRRLLSDHRLADELAENGFRYVQDQLSERVYVEKYYELIRVACQ